MQFVICVDSASYEKEDMGVHRTWIVRMNGDLPVIGKDFNLAERMTIERATEVYLKLVTPVRKLGIIPVN
jgi:hypothetical protein